MRPWVLIASLVAVIISADAKDDATKKDLEKFPRELAVDLRFERDGKKTPQEEAKKLTLSIQGNKFISVPGRTLR